MSLEVVALGDHVYFKGESRTLPNGDKLMHGRTGKVTGIQSFAGHELRAVQFAGNKGSVDCFVTQVRGLHAASASPPACLLGQDLQLNCVHR